MHDKPRPISQPAWPLDFRPKMKRNQCAHQTATKTNKHTQVHIDMNKVETETLPTRTGAPSSTKTSRDTERDAKVHHLDSQHTHNVRAFYFSTGEKL